MKRLKDKKTRAKSLVGIKKDALSINGNDKEKNLTFEEERFDTSLFLERRRSETRVKLIESVGGIETWWQYFMAYSIFGLRFGVFIKNGTRYVTNLSLVSTVVLCFSIIWILIYSFSQIVLVDSCCNVFYEKPDNQTDSKYNV